MAVTSVVAVGSRVTSVSTGAGEAVGATNVIRLSIVAACWVMSDSRVAFCP